MSNFLLIFLKITLLIVCYLQHSFGTLFGALVALTWTIEVFGSDREHGDVFGIYPGQQLSLIKIHVMGKRGGRPVGIWPQVTGIPNTWELGWLLEVCMVTGSYLRVQFWKDNSDTSHRTLKERISFSLRIKTSFLLISNKVEFLI